ncbi:MAG: hypothetical protein O3A46_13710 [Candidatus Poribacteria bacterium]|nr:hypothetical protein [Candidatus Poribacteria bacterium]
MSTRKTLWIAFLVTMSAVGHVSAQIRIAWVSTRGDGFTREIHLEDGEGNYIGQISPPNLGEYHEIEWSPDGRKIVCSLNPLGAFNTTSDIYTINADGSNLTRLTHKPDGWNLSPSWSPDGSRIVFNSENGDKSDLFVVDSDGTGLTRLFPGGKHIMPEWSPDGESIVFASDMGGLYDIFVLSLESGEIDQLTHIDGERAWYPTWSPDGNMIAYKIRNDVYLMDADGANNRQVMTDVMPLGDPAWVDRKTIICTATNPESEDTTS